MTAPPWQQTLDFDDHPAAVYGLVFASAHDKLQALGLLVDVDVVESRQVRCYLDRAYVLSNLLSKALDHPKAVRAVFKYYGRAQERRTSNHHVATNSRTRTGTLQLILVHETVCIRMTHRTRRLYIGFIKESGRSFYRQFKLSS